MKQLAAIVFLSLVLFNLAGYRLVIDLMQYRQEQTLNLRIDRNEYDGRDLFTIKVPVSLPYYTNSQTFERVEGSVEVGGTPYHYVKRRIYQDSIEYVCLPNRDKKSFTSARDEFMKLCVDWQKAPQSKKAPVMVKALTFDFFEDGPSYNLLPLPDALRVNSLASCARIPQTFPERDGPPPEGFAALPI